MTSFYPRLLWLVVVMLLAAVVLLLWKQTQLESDVRRLEGALAARAVPMVREQPVPNAEAPPPEPAVEEPTVATNHLDYIEWQNAMEQRLKAMDHLLEQTVKTVVRAESERTAATSRSPVHPVAEAYALAAEKGRNWGPEQATGEPDTSIAGDIVTAWASRKPNAGEEWLQLDYEKMVTLSEIRVWETLNPGAISRVAAVLPDGNEAVIWEGHQDVSAPLNEAVFSVNQNLQANSVVVYLDTTRVDGWNEIDAVELVGGDGTRQWASEVTSSSTYAEPAISR